MKVKGAVFFIASFTGGFLCAVLILYFSALHILPLDLLTGSRDDLACALTHCQESAYEASVIVYGLRAGRKLRPWRQEFSTQEFWQAFQTRYKDDLERIGGKVLSAQESTFRDVPRANLLLEALGRKAAEMRWQNKSKIEAASLVATDAEKEVYALVYKYAEGSKTPPPAESGAIPAARSSSPNPLK